MYLRHFIFLVFLLLLASPVDATTCTVRNSGCFFDESCIFSMFSETNAHISECGMAYTYNVCCTTDLFPSDCYVNTTGTCPADEGGVLSMFNITNSHAELYNLGNYNNNLCCPTLAGWDSYDCHFNATATCDTDETAVVTMYNYTNSHVGNLSDYNNILCCKTKDLTPPTTIVGFDANNIHVIELGKTEKIYVEIKNPTPTKKSVPLYIGSFDMIKNWIWFEGHKYDTRRNITMTIDAYAEKIVVVNVLGGKTGDYSITIGPDSDYANRYDEIPIKIVSKASGIGIFSSTPGLGVLSLLFILLAGAFLR